MRAPTAYTLGLLALAAALAPACFWEGRSGLDAAAFHFRAPRAVDATMIPVDGGPDGACSGEADQALITDAVEAIDAARSSCGAQCFSEADITACNADCLATSTGLSVACATCYGADSACTISFCLTQCTQPDSAACQSCREAYCSAAFEACAEGQPMPDAGYAPDSAGPPDTGGSVDTTLVPDAATDASLDANRDAAAEDSGAIVPGACVNSADQDLLADPNVDVPAAVSGCGASCFGQPDMGQCTSDCLAAATGLSAACADCYGDDTACTVAFCMAECIQPDSEPCQSCRGVNCSTAFAICVNGLTLPDAGVVPDAAGVADVAQIPDASCCADVLSLDVIDAANLPDSAALPDLATAFDAAPEDSAVATPGACVNGTDQGVLSDPGVDVPAAVSGCGASCFGQPDVAQCTGDCVAAATGLSASCAGCFGADTACTIGFCLTECADPQSQACLICRANACVPAFQYCAFGAPSEDAGAIEDAS